MNYITVKEAAKKWQIAERSVQNYCAAAKIPGVKRVGGQWLIPFDAKLPLDGRTKKAKNSPALDNYKFPVFLYSRFYRDSSELTQDEQTLLRAQVLHFEGNHIQSIILCNDLLKSDIPAYLKAGAYLTMGIDAFLLGLLSQYEKALLNLKKLSDTETINREDFLLMAQALKFYIDWNSSDILQIQPSKLSSEAVWYYQTLLFSSYIISAEAISAYTLKLLESECAFFQKEGMAPMLYFFLCGLGITSDFGRTPEEKDLLLNRGVELAIDYNWVSNLHRFYNFSPKRLEKCIKSHGPAYYQELMRAHQVSLTNWNIIHIKETGTDYVGTYTSKQFELLLLIAYGYTNKEIALCTGLPEISVRRDVKELMEISKTENRVQLRKYAKKFFDKAELTELR